jgi:hypothetical protein
MESMAREDLFVNEDTAPSMPSTDNADQQLGNVACPAPMFENDVQGMTIDDNDPYYCCAAHRLCQSIGNQTSQFCINVYFNQSVHLFCAEYLMEQKPVKDLLYISAKDLTKEGKERWKKTKASEKENVVFCILCEAKMKAVKVVAEAMKLAKESNKRQLASLGRAPKKKMKSTKATAGIICERAAWLHLRHSYTYLRKLRKQKPTLDIR